MDNRELTIDEISSKLKVSRQEAKSVYDIIKIRKMPLSRAGMVLSLAKEELRERGIPILPNLGSQMLKIDKNLAFNEMISNKKNLSKDRHDTRVIKSGRFTDIVQVTPGKKSFTPGANGEMTGFRVTPIGDGGYTNKFGHEKSGPSKKPAIKSIPAYTIRTKQGEVPAPRMLPAPKFYYIDKQGLFSPTGHDTPPVQDPHFRHEIGKGKFVPFIMAHIGYKRQASKYPKILYVFDETTMTRVPLTDSNGEVLREQDTGEKTVHLDLYIGEGNYIESIALEMPYLFNARFNEQKARKSVEFIYKKLLEMRDKYAQPRTHTRYDDDIKTSEQALESYYGDEFYQLEQNKREGNKLKLLNKKERDQLQKEWVDRKYAELPALTTLGLRKRKLKAASAKRKQVIKKKITKKPIKKPSGKIIKRCVCKNIRRKK
jgi:hypothetical protein